jgi:hypothetical protein
MTRLIVWARAANGPGRAGGSHIQIFGSRGTRSSHPPSRRVFCIVYPALLIDARTGVLLVGEAL